MQPMSDDFGKREADGKPLHEAKGTRMEGAAGLCPDVQRPEGLALAFSYTKAEENFSSVREREKAAFAMPLCSVHTPVH